MSGRRLYGAMVLSQIYAVNSILILADTQYRHAELRRPHLPIQVPPTVRPLKDAMRAYP
jgi:hypothetical protein